MLIKNLIKTGDDSSYNARADRCIQTGRVVLVDRTAGQALLDVGMVNADGNAVYMEGVGFSPQTPPHSQDNVALDRTNSSPYSMHIGSGQVGGANSGQVVDGPFVHSIKKTGETSGQQGDLTLDPGTGITITRTNKTFSIAEAHSGILGGLLGTGVSLTLNGEHYLYQYNTGLSGDTNVTLPNLQLASGADTALEYEFVNFSAHTVTVTANTTTFTNTIETVASFSLGPGHYATFSGIQGVGSDGVWRVTNINSRLIPGLTHAGTTYTLAITDLGTSVEFTSSSAVTVTVPPNSSVNLPIDAIIEITQMGAGTVTLVAGAGVTLRAGGGLSCPYQYATIRIRQQAADVWVVTNICSSTGSGSAPDSAHYVTTQAESGLSAEFNLGSLTTGMLKHTVSGSVSTPATATEGTDYYKPGGTDVAVADGGTGSSTAGGARTNLGVAVQSISVVLNNGSSALAVGQYVDLVFEYACTISQNTLLADQSGSVQLDLRVCSYSDFDDSAHPVSGDSICASAKPTITTATKSQDSTLTGWTTSITAGQIMRVYVVSATTIQQVTLSLKVTRA